MGWVGVSKAGSLGFAVSPVDTAQQGGLGRVRGSPGCGPWAHPAQEKAGASGKARFLPAQKQGGDPAPAYWSGWGAQDERELIKVVRNKGSLSTASNSS